MKPTISTRRARANDADLISRLGSETFNQTYGPIFDPYDVAAHIKNTYDPEVVSRELNAEFTAYFISDANGEPAGFSKLRVVTPVDGVRGERPVQIQQMYILQEFHRLGIGRRLMTTNLNAARESNADSVWLTVWNGAEWAQSFYRACGFERVGTWPFQLGSSQQTDFVMWRWLDDG